MFTLNRLNRASPLLVLPMMALALLWAFRTSTPGESVAMPREGTIVVAGLRAESLTFVRPGLDQPARSLALPGPPHELVFAGGRLYATLGRADLLAEVEPRGPGILREVALAGAPHGLAVEGDDLLVTLDTGNALVRLDRASLAERGRTATGDTPHMAARDGQDVYVTDSRDGRIRLVRDPATVAAAGSLPEGVAVVGDTVVVADAEGGTVYLFQRETLEPLGTVVTGGHPVRIVALDATHAVVSLNAAAKVAVVDVAKRRVERTVDTEARPDGICISPSGEFVGVASNAADVVQVFRLRDWKLAGSLTASHGPGSCLWLP